MLAYSALLTLALVLSSPWWLARMFTTQRYREGLGERLGRVPARLREVVSILGSQGRVIWIHAVSVGEVLAATRLVSELESHPQLQRFHIVISTTTRTGQALARERFGAKRVFHLPLDFAWAVRAYLRALQPAALVLMESELWPRMLHECAIAKIPVAVVNARSSDRSFRRAMRVRPIWKHVLRQPSLWLAQSEDDARRLVALGARAETVQVAGNLKYDVRPPKKNRVAELIKVMAGSRAILVAGSTVGAVTRDTPSEEEIVWNAWRDLPRRDSGLMLVLAPRHPERFQFAESVIDTSYARASELESRVSPERFPIESDVIVLDTIGDLAAIYGIADVAFVGGSLVKRGGHNPLEPAQFGVPVIMGPSFENFRDIVAKLQAADGIRIVQNQGELEAALVELLSNREAAREMGERGQRVFEQQQGATARSVEALVAMLQSNEGGKP
jgi:3-deoxy-D-manno-octulosonic-acid transferase